MCRKKHAHLIDFAVFRKLFIESGQSPFADMAVLVSQAVNGALQCLQ